ncbi:MAG: DUF2769 domain-containing protein [Methanoregula sp.]
MSRYLELNAHERQALLHDIIATCKCPTCPSYNRCAREKEEKFYCFRGKSMFCISENRGCLCLTCAFSKEIGMKYYEFCLRGSETVQRYEHEIR